MSSAHHKAGTASGSAPQQFADANHASHLLQIHHPDSEGVITQDPAMLDAIDDIRRIAKADESLLLTGETGAGKGVLAQIFHENSKRKDGPLIKMNCAAISPHLFESELFGHEKGSFTGAETQHIGAFEQADGCTIFLDEIGELTLEQQAKLLHVLGDDGFTRVGSQQTIKPDFLLVAATNQDLEAMTHAGKFRKDLLFRLNTFSINVPPLRERKNDIIELAQATLKEYKEHYDRSNLQFSPEALQTLQQYPWPGNVRELINVIRKATLLAKEEIIHPEDLKLQQNQPTGDLAMTNQDLLDELTKRGLTHDDLKTHQIREALRQTGGVRRSAAEILGINRNTLASEIERLEIEPK